jgi:hypothetical protein
MQDESEIDRYYYDALLVVERSTSDCGSETEEQVIAAPDGMWPGKRPIDLSFHRGMRFSSEGARDRESFSDPSQPGDSAHPVSEDG